MKKNKIRNNNQKQNKNQTIPNNSQVKGGGDFFYPDAEQLLSNQNADQSVSSTRNSNNDQSKSDKF
jgi:hypothetical protein